MRLIPLAWMAKIHYPSFLQFETKKAAALLDKTMQALGACDKLRQRMAGMEDRRVQEAMVSMDLLYTLFEMKASTLRIRLTDLETRRMMYNAFNTKLEKGMSDELFSLNDQITQAILDLNVEIQGDLK